MRNKKLQNKPNTVENPSQSKMPDEVIGAPLEPKSEGTASHFFKFGIPLHKLCPASSLNPANCFLQIKDGFINATNGELMAHISLADLEFPGDVIDEIEGYYLHRDAFKHIYNKDLEYKDGALVSVDGIEAPLIDSGKFLKLAGKPYADVKDYIANIGRESKLDRIGLNGGLSNIIFGVFKGYQIKVSFPVQSADNYLVKLTFVALQDSLAFISPLTIIDGV